MDKPESQSFIWLENDGKMNFTLHNIANPPTHILTLESADFNKDGLMDLLPETACLSPYDGGQNTLW